METLDLAVLEHRLETSFLGRRVIYRESIDSTQDLARAEAEEDAPEGTLVLADAQTAGRGRQGRSWVSPPASNLYFTLVLRPSIDQLTRLGMIVPLAIAQGLETATPLVCGIKWPNDVFVKGKKISGALIDSDIDGDIVRFALVGIGINVNFDLRLFPEIADTATSVLTETGTNGSREAILAAVLNAFETHYAANRAPALFTEWRGRLINLGKRVAIHDYDGTVVEGLAESVKESGALLLKLDDGTVREFSAGQLNIPNLLPARDLA
ncbi:MAG TPA: biotin--[acetyl-CoA-carboxylase] ligase [Dehalococcoidia bacterium]|nr:biotin--[acetyl-CoA-carboxylase] ligase [Dehalococcoidia bacterium]